jgi:hypothetical protein
MNMMPDNTYGTLKAKAILIAVTLPLVLSSVWAQAPSAPALPDCNASGPLRYVCGLAGPEDLAAVPQTKWLLASAMQGEGGLYLIDTTQAQSTGSKIFPAAGAETRKFSARPPHPACRLLRSQYRSATSCGWVHSAAIDSSATRLPRANKLADHESHGVTLPRFR